MSACPAWRGQLFDLVDEEVTAPRRTIVEDAEPRRRILDGWRRRIDSSQGGGVLDACGIERRERFHRSFVGAQREARLVGRERGLVNLGSWLPVAGEPVDRATHAVGRVLDEPADGEGASARTLPCLFLRQADERGADGVELLVDVVDDALEFVVRGRCVHATSLNPNTGQPLTGIPECHQQESPRRLAGVGGQWGGVDSGAPSVTTSD